MNFSTFVQYKVNGIFDTLVFKEVQSSYFVSKFCSDLGVGYYFLPELVMDLFHYLLMIELL